VIFEYPLLAQNGHQFDLILALAKVPNEADAAIQVLRMRMTAFFKAVITGGLRSSLVTSEFA
jgi:hypothetical protein